MDGFPPRYFASANWSFGRAEARAPPRPPDACWAQSILHESNGNRCHTQTFVRGDKLLAAPASAIVRHAMVELQARLRFEPPSRILAEFTRQIERAPTEEQRARWRLHRGEVRLW